MGCPLDEANLNDDIPKIFLGTTRQEKSHMSFYMTLQINDLLLRNCMLDSGASNNIMTLEVMNQLGLQITRLYRNVRDMYAREVACFGIIENLQICLFACPQRRMVMDVVIIDYPTQWGMLLSRKWCTYVGGTLQIDLTYVDIPVEDNFKIRVFREQKMLHNVEDPRIGDNDPMFPGIKEPEAEEGDLGDYMLTNDVDPPIHVVPKYEPHQVWLMQFDGSSSYIASGACILFTSPNCMVYPFLTIWSSLVLTTWTSMKPFC
jgi:hypothetical protein